MVCGGVGFPDLRLAHTGSWRGWGRGGAGAVVAVGDDGGETGDNGQAGAEDYGSDFREPVCRIRFDVSNCDGQNRKKM